MIEDKREIYYRIEITAIAKNILKNFYDYTFPINPLKIANNLGLKVEEAEFDRNDISGMIDVLENKIIISALDVIERKRFSIAHEIGHYVLHYKGFKGMENKTFKNKERHISYRDNISTLGFSISEIEANYFAANLLMPEDEVKRIFNQYKDVRLTANYFWVSESALCFRLNYLGLY